MLAYTEIKQFFLIDGARLQHNLGIIKGIATELLSLYKGRMEESWADVGPYLFIMPQDKDFMDWYITNGWSNAWGLIVETEASFEDCWKHFRKFLLVKAEDGQELYFRFYDPRVLKIFLPTCDEKQIMEFFGPVDEFIVEGNSKEEAIGFSHRNGLLKQRKLIVEEVFGNIKTIIV